MFSNEYLEKIKEFLTGSNLLNLKKKETIFYANEEALNIFYIKNGFIRVYRISEQGDELTLTILKPGDFFPLNYGISNFPNNFFLEAITPLEAYKVSKEKFYDFLKDNPEVFFELTSNTLNRFDGLLARMEYLIIGRAYEKVATTIWACAQSFGEKEGSFVILGLPLTHKDIATLVGITRETTCLEMKKMEKQGLISHRGKHLIINDIKKLETEVFLGNNFDISLNYL